MQLSDDFPLMMEREAGAPENCPMVAVAFGLHPVIDSKRSKESGRDVYKDVEFVKIAVPGDRNSLVFQPSDDVYRRRFPRAYDSFKQREHNPLIGTPVEHWPPISRAVALNLKVLHIYTVEALAEVHEGHIDRVGSNGRELRTRAQAWLKDAKDGAASQELAAKNKALEDQLASLQAQINALQQPLASNEERVRAPIVMKG